MSLEQLRRTLATPTTSIQLSLLGLVGGTIAALLIILFRLSIEKLQFFITNNFDDFSQLDNIERFALPVIGAVMIAIFADFTGYKHYRLGIPFVMHRIKTRYGLMPLWNTVNQFVGGVIALVCGFSVGREGPSVHLGAAGSSLLGNRLKLPYNSIRTLVGCGIAAAIAASFNTPLAAVIFVMEVVLREYKIHIFIPVMLSAFIGALVTRFVFGDTYEFNLLHVVPLPGIHYPYLVLCGILFGAVAYAFNKNLMIIIKTFRPLSMFPRLLLAGLITAFVGYFVPQALGSGMGAIQFAVSEPGNTQLLLTIFIGKLLATLFALGLGIPGGLIGPIFGLGIVLGTLLSALTPYFSADVNVAGTYAVIGMAGLMAAVLHAPLAALVAVMELTYSPAIIAPAMLVIVSAYITASQFFNNRSIFLQQLDYQKLSYQVSPAISVLQKYGVLAKLATNNKVIDNADDLEVRHYLQTLDSDQQLIIRDTFEMGVEYRLAEYDVQLGTTDATPVKYWPLQGINSQSTLAEAYELLHEKRDGAVYVYHDNVENFIGIIRWDQVRSILTQRSDLL
ncbi:chloride channel protein [Flocculibacter collagenilyticus]|uniref:chloride channel protein n=1 Tax=Flocculibacter collagenilyticus TaxID=2744479 RepID=UPI0018F53CC4|nr:chloride channel protein [Flocculibacter collagenilyticus]